MQTTERLKKQNIDTSQKGDRHVEKENTSVWLDMTALHVDHTEAFFPLRDD